jgi:hypothetical protein
MSFGQKDFRSVIAFTFVFAALGYTSLTSENTLASPMH